MNKRIAKLRTFLEEQQIDGIMISKPENKEATEKVPYF